jgi:hypothetical protein
MEEIGQGTEDTEHTVAQLLEALRYKPVGRGFASRYCHFNSSLS